MAEFMIRPDGRRQTKKFQVKPVSVVNQGSSSEFLSRPVKLKVLSSRRIVKLLCNSENYFNHFLNHSDSLPHCLRNEILHQVELRSQQHNDKVFRFSVSNSNNSNSSDQFSYMLKLWLKLFSSDTLVLREFLGHHWSRSLFQHIAREEKKYPDIKKLTLQSNEVNQERLCFLFELSENTWKPQMIQFLTKLPHLTHLTLKDFCDDDTLCNIAYQCPLLQYLCVVLGAESFSEQQLSDDGFSDLIEKQVEHQTLRELDLSQCHSSNITGKTILYLNQLQSLDTLHVRKSHFAWMELSVKFLGDDFRSSQSLRTLSLTFDENDNEVGSFNVDYDKLFPRLQDVRLYNIKPWSSYLQNLSQNMMEMTRVCGYSTTNDLEKVVKSQLRPAVMMIEIYMNPSLGQDTKFENLVDLRLTKEMFSTEFKLICDFMRACPRLKYFQVEALSLSHYDEDQFIELFHKHDHLKNLIRLSLHFRSTCSITVRFLEYILENCPLLEKIDNLLSWSVSVEDMEVVGRHDKVVMFASKNHWSLPWRCEDGTMIEIHQTPTGVMRDMFDNY